MSQRLKKLKIMDVTIKVLCLHIHLKSLTRIIELIETKMHNLDKHV